MRAITVARKPVSEGTVASNVLKHKTGALNIKNSRIGTEVVSTHSRGKNMAFPKRPGEDTVEESGRKVRQDLVDHSDRMGRWPANFILQHKEGCRCDADISGMETVVNWICVEGCPVVALDEQSGVVPTGTWVRLKEAHKYYNQKEKEIGDCKEWKTVVEPAGGASRYFKQVK